MSIAYNLTINTPSIGISSTVSRCEIFLRRATVFDSFVIVPDLKVTVPITSGDGSVKLLPNTSGSVYEAVFYNQYGQRDLYCYFIMPNHDVALVDLELMTSWGGSGGDGSGGSGSGLPNGGLKDQVLTKNSNANGDASWKDAPTSAKIIKFNPETNGEPTAIPDDAKDGQVIELTGDWFEGSVLPTTAVAGDQYLISNNKTTFTKISESPDFFDYDPITLGEVHPIVAEAAVTGTSVSPTQLTTNGDPQPTINFGVQAPYIAGVLTNMKQGALEYAIDSSNCLVVISVSDDSVAAIDGIPNGIAPLLGGIPNPHTPISAIVSSNGSGLGSGLLIAPNGVSNINLSPTDNVLRVQVTPTTIIVNGVDTQVSPSLFNKLVFGQIAQGGTTGTANYSSTFAGQSVEATPLPKNMVDGNVLRIINHKGTLCGLSVKPEDLVVLYSGLTKAQKINETGRVIAFNPNVISPVNPVSGSASSDVTATSLSLSDTGSPATHDFGGNPSATKYIAATFSGAVSGNLTVSPATTAERTYSFMLFHKDGLQAALTELANVGYGNPAATLIKNGFYSYLLSEPQVAGVSKYLLSTVLPSADSQYSFDADSYDPVAKPVNIEIINGVYVVNGLITGISATVYPNISIVKTAQVDDGSGGVSPNPDEITPINFVNNLTFITENALPENIQDGDVFKITQAGKLFAQPVAYNDLCLLINNQTAFINIAPVVSYYQYTCYSNGLTTDLIPNKGSVLTDVGLKLDSSSTLPSFKFDSSSTLSVVGVTGKIILGGTGLKLDTQHLFNGTGNKAAFIIISQSAGSFTLQEFLDVWTNAVNADTPISLSLFAYMGVVAVYYKTTIGGNPRVINWFDIHGSTSSVVESDELNLVRSVTNWYEESLYASSNANKIDVLNNTVVTVFWGTDDVAENSLLPIQNNLTGYAKTPIPDYVNDACIVEIVSVANGFPNTLLGHPAQRGDLFVIYANKSKAIRLHDDPLPDPTLKQLNGGGIVGGGIAQIEQSDFEFYDLPLYSDVTDWSFGECSNNGYVKEYEVQIIQNDTTQYNCPAPTEAKVCGTWVDRLPLGKRMLVQFLRDRIGNLIVFPSIPY